MLRATAWKLAKAYAAATGFKEEEAFEKLLAEEQVDPVAA
jgi:hypothetical protein